MKITFKIILLALFMLITTGNILSQSAIISPKLGIHTGISANFNGYQQSDNPILAIYLAPYLRIKQHEFHVGILYPFTSYEGWDGPLNSHIDAIAGYKYYLLKFPRLVNIFLHYEFQYLWFSGNVQAATKDQHQYTETEIYFNNLIGLGFCGFFDQNKNFGFSWSLGYILPNKNKRDVYRNYLNANLGFYFTLTSFKKKEIKKEIK